MLNQQPAGPSSRTGRFLTQGHENESMRGTIRKISLRRRVIIDLMRASMDVPFVTLSRTLDVKRLAEARASLHNAPGWAAIFAKAFSLVAKDDPILRTLYMGWPWPHFYE